MSNIVIWIDQEHAKVFHVSGAKSEGKYLQERHAEHHTHQLDHLDQAKNEKQFFSKVATYLSDSDRILILGPGVAKSHFQTHLVEQFPMLAKKVAGCETVDHPTDHQITAVAKRFFGSNPLLS